LGALFGLNKVENERSGSGTIGTAERDRRGWKATDHEKPGAFAKMSATRLCDPRAVATLLLAGLCALAPGSARGQFAAVVNTNSRYAGNSTGSSAFSGDTGAANATSLNALAYVAFDSLGDLFVSDTANNCVRKIDTSGNVTTVAGLRVNGGPDTCNTSGNPTPTAAQGLLKPTGLAVDGSNALYIADSQHNCVRSLAAGTVDSFAVNALTTVAGTCQNVDTASVTPVPNGLAVDASANLYISIQDSLATLPVNQVVKHAAGNPATTVCYLAGQASANVATQCAGVTGTVTLASPAGLAFDATGDLFIADTGNNCVREIAGLTTQQTAVGQCSNDHSGNPATAVLSPYGLAFSPGQALYISEMAANHSNVVSYSAGALTLVAGLPNGTSGPYMASTDGKSSLNASLNGPLGLTTDANGNIYLADSLNNVVREMSTGTIFPAEAVGASSGTQIVTFEINQSVNLSATAGTDYSIASTTCIGALSAATAGSPPNTCQALVSFTPSRPGMRSSALQLKDSLSGKIVSVATTGVGTGPLSLLTPGTVSSPMTGLRAPIAVSTDSAGDAYVLEQGNGTTTADVLLLPAGGGAIRTVVPQGAGLATVTGMAVDAAGNIFITEASTNVVIRFGADGTVNLSYVTGLVNATAIAVDEFDNLYIAQGGTAHNVIEVYASGTRRVVAGSGTTAGANGVAATTSLMVTPSALALGPGGLSIADDGGHLVYTVDGTGTIHIIAGNGTTVTTTPGLALDTGLLLPAGLAADAAGDIYISDEAANRVYEVYPVTSNGVNISGPLGTGVTGYTGDGGPANMATMNSPLTIALDGSSNLFAIDFNNQALREVVFPGTANINFGHVIIGTTSPVMTQGLANAGNQGLSLTTPFTTSDTHYAVSSSSTATTCTSTLAVGGTCTIGFTFTPTVLGPLAAQSVVTSNFYGSPQTVQLNAYGLFTQNLPYSLPAENEVYGAPFVEPVTLNLVFPDLTPTGSMVFTIAGETTCTATGPFPASFNCNAPESGIGVGTYLVDFAYTSGDNSYFSTMGATTLTVTPAAMSVTPTNETKMYGAPIPALPATIVGEVNDDRFLYTDTTTATQASPVGTYPINATLTPVGLASLNNYNITYNVGTLTVAAIPLTVTVNNASRAYGAANPTFTGTVVGAANGDTFTVTYSTVANTLSPAGTYAINATVTGANISNYAVTVVAGTLTVTPIPLTVTVANATRTYGTTNPTFSATITGAINGDTFTNSFSTTATITSPVGTYPITDVLGGPAAGNYTVTLVPGTLTITKASVGLTVAVNNATRTYGVANPTFTSTITGALNGDTFTITYATPATISSPVGTYTVVPTVSGPAVANYTITTVNGTLTITLASAPLVVTVNSVTRPYGSANPTFTSTITGALNGDTFTVTYATTATIASSAGTYPITATVAGAALANYTLSVVPGTLTIAPAATTTVLTTSQALVYLGTNITFTAVVTSAGGVPTGTVNFYNGTMLLGAVALDPTGTAVFNISTLPAGSYTITATYVASTNFATSSATVAQTVSPGSFALTSGPVNEFIRGPGASVFTITATSVNNFTGPVTLSCAGLPADATCSFTSPTLTLMPGGTASSTMTVITTESDARLDAPAMRGPGSGAGAGNGGGGGEFAPVAVAAVLPFELSGLGVFFAGLWRRGRRGLGERGPTGRACSAIVRLGFLLICTMGLLGLVGCACFTSVYQTYTVTVTGTSSIVGVSSQTTSVTLSVGEQ
jgi:hypothetical protein